MKTKKNITNKLTRIFDEHKISLENIYIGGFSSGGNLVMLLSNDLVKKKNKLQPKGIFIVDSPIDLEKLYDDATKDVKDKKHAPAVEEGNFLVDLLNKELGSPKTNLSFYKKYSPFILHENSQKNIEYLNHIRIRLYVEPNLHWQKKNRNREYKDLNAFVLEKAALALKKYGNKNVEFIKTQNRGVKADGSIHPHSWNLVERESLIKWIHD